MHKTELTISKKWNAPQIKHLDSQIHKPLVARLDLS